MTADEAKELLTDLLEAAKTNAHIDCMKKYDEALALAIEALTEQQKRRQAWM